MTWFWASDKQSICTYHFYECVWHRTSEEIVSTATHCSTTDKQTHVCVYTRSEPEPRNCTVYTLTFDHCSACAAIPWPTQLCRWPARLPTFLFCWHQPSGRPSGQVGSSSSFHYLGQYHYKNSWLIYSCSENQPTCQNYTRDDNLSLTNNTQLLNDIPSQNTKVEET